MPPALLALLDLLGLVDDGRAAFVAAFRDGNVTTFRRALALLRPNAEGTYRAVSACLPARALIMADLAFWKVWLANEAALSIVATNRTELLSRDAEPARDQLTALFERCVLLDLPPRHL